MAENSEPPAKYENEIPHTGHNLLHPQPQYHDPTANQNLPCHHKSNQCKSCEFHCPNMPRELLINSCLKNEIRAL